MRTRKQIEASTGNPEVASYLDNARLMRFQKLQLEVLLDIRELLQQSATPNLVLTFVNGDSVAYDTFERSVDLKSHEGKGSWLK